MSFFANKVNRSNLITVIVMAALTACICCPAVAQDEDGPKVPDNTRDMITKQMLMSQIMQVVYNTDLQEELAMVPDQVAELKEISQAYQKEMMTKGTKTLEMSTKVQALMADGKHQEAADLGKELQKHYMESINRITDRATEALLPHQVERLQQISKQQSMKAMNKFGDEFGIPYAMASDLDLTKDEKKRLEETTKRVRKQYYADLEAMKAKAKQEILDELSIEQQAMLSELLGDFYDHDSSMRAMRKKQAGQMKKMMGDAKGSGDSEEK